ncbi:epoxide hydrolase [Paenibacillus sp. PR3]|uniref:Epoxide hydrolase n=1 Tax=Paenibacillus terricola TaxID=2763503 RepID=A0ABR8MUA2_9BACL|nr:epoxide hydrolase family protein [Paenibacillus terricola]MBD3919473.1 epoxide hydrolase [Paenibacillus terricola]
MTNVNQMTQTVDSEIRPFHIAVPQSDLDDLRQRLSLSRLPHASKSADWKYGSKLSRVQELIAYWNQQYDWRKHESRLNSWPQFTTTIDGANIHFMHIVSPEPDAIPLLLTHAWPSSIAEFLDVIGPLSNPSAYGGNPKDAFHLVIPSVPGFGFSGSDLGEGWDIPRIAKAWDTLMKRLGYMEYGSHGSDVGTLVSRELGVQRTEGLLGIHVLQLFSFPSGDPAEMEGLSQDDWARLQFLGAFQDRAGFNVIQSTRPQTLAYALSDSPVGQLSWILDMFDGFGDHEGFIDQDALLTNVMIYWLTNTAESSSRLYYENAHVTNPLAGEKNAALTGISVFGNDFRTIRRFAERDNTNIVFWTEHERGTHFAAIDEPETLTSDIRSFFRRFR